MAATDVRLLNSDASQAVQESMLVAQAGMSSHITVSTHMAGRGTDILLGGDPAQLLLLVLAQPFNSIILETETNYNSSRQCVEARTEPAEALLATFEVEVCASCVLQSLVRSGSKSSVRDVFAGLDAEL